jgi:hypothetical protein
LAFFGIAHPPDFGESLRPGQFAAELLEHPATGQHWRELIGIPDQDRPDAGLCRGERVRRSLR